MDEGYIKYKNLHYSADPPDSIYVRELNKWRNRLHEIGLIGVYEDGIGFGNISRRFKQDTFIISGSATGNITQLNSQHYVLVTEFSILKNELVSHGLIAPSSESLTHGIIYQTLPKVKSVIHVHAPDLWMKYKNILPTSSEHISYGTTEMALEVKRLILSKSAHSTQVIIMGGHTDGIIVYGNSMEEVGTHLVRLTQSIN